MGMIMHDDVPYGEGTSYTQGTGIAINNNVIAVDADNTPTENSEKPVKSKGVYEEIEQIYADNGVLGAKNLIPYPYAETTSTKNGITFTVNSDGSVTANGTATAQTRFHFTYQNKFTLPSGDYILTDGTSDSASATYVIDVAPYKNGSWIQKQYNTINGIRRFTLDSSEYDGLQIYIQIRSGITVSNLTFYPMIRLASDPDDTYVPYAMTNRELTEDRYYHAGDTVNVSLMNFSALITNSSKEIRFTIPLMKDLSKITGITFKNTTTVGIRKPGGGYVVDGTLSSGYTIAVLAKAGNLLSLKLTKTDNSAFDATNNTPLDIAFTGGSNDSVITFS